MDLTFELQIVLFEQEIEGVQLQIEHWLFFCFEVDYFKGVESDVDGAVVGDVDVGLAVVLLFHHGEDLVFGADFEDSLLDMIGPPIGVFFVFAVDDLINNHGL